MSKKYLSRTELFHCLYEVASCLKAGVSLPEGMRQYSEVVKSRQCSGFAREVSCFLEKGYSLSESMRRCHYRISESTLSMIKCAELSEDLAGCLKFLCDFESVRRKNYYLFVNLLIYPVLLGVVAYGAAWTVFTFVTPVYVEYARLVGMKEMPWLSQQYIKVSSVIGGWNGVWVFLGVMAAVSFVLSMGKFRYCLWRHLIQVPFLRTMVIRSDTVVMTRLLGELVGRGVDLGVALGAVKGVVLTPALQLQVDRMIEAHEKGESVGSFFGREVPALGVRLFHQADSLKKLSEACLLTSQLCEEKYAASVYRFACLIEPLAVLFIGLWIVLGIVIQVSPFGHCFPHGGMMIK